mgnify:CR=1 FL=1
MLANRIRNIIEFFDSRGLDLLFLACVTSLILIGLVMVTSSTVDFAAAKFSNPLFFLRKHFTAIDPYQLVYNNDIHQIRNYTVWSIKMHFFIT